MPGLGLTFCKGLTSAHRTRDEARASLFDYIECVYNRKRRHGFLGNISPTDYENLSALNQAQGPFPFLTRLLREYGL